LRMLIFLIVFLVVAVLVVHNLPSPFPSPRAVLDEAYESLLAELGPPSDLDPNAQLPAQLRSGKSVVWIRPHMLAVWKLQVDYRATRFGPQARPDSVSRSLETKWNWVNFVLPFDSAFRAYVQVPQVPN
jgi:hypothetical protein